MRKGFEKFLITLIRLSMGWIFLWKFLDKLFGFGYDTPKGEAWIDGVSPTESFLMYSTQGSPFSEVLQVMAGQPWVDWLFMIGLAGIGVALILGIMIRLAGVAGAFMSLFIFLAVIPPASNPLITYHVVYIFVFLLLAAVPCGEWFGLGKWWGKTWLIKGFPFLK